MRPAGDAVHHEPAATPGAGRDLGWLVLAATGTLALFLALWAVAVPMYRAVDEPQHLSTSLRLANGDGYPAPGTALLERQVSASYGLFDFPGGDFRTFVPPQVVRVDPPAHWPTLQSLRDAVVPAAQAKQVDQETQHPPAWALLAAGEIKVLESTGIGINSLLIALRLLQGLLLLPVPWLIWRTARELGAAQTAAGAACFLPSLVPEFTHIGASITDGDLLCLEFGIAILLTLRLARGTLSRSGQLALALVVAVALLTKAFGLILLPMILLALLLRVRGTRAWRPALPLAALTIVAPALAGGWWYVLRYATTGDLQPSGYPPDVQVLFRDTLSAGQAVSRFSSMLLTSSIGSYGWFELPSSVTLSAIAWALATLLVVVGLRQARRLGSLGAATVALAPFLVLLVGVVAREFQTYHQLQGVYGAQGRYLYPGLTAVAACIAVGLSTPRLRLGVVLPAIVVGVVGFQLWGLLTSVSYFWQGGFARATKFVAWGPFAVFLVVAGLGLAAWAAGRRRAVALTSTTAASA